MHEEDARDEADALTVPDLPVEQGVGLEQVEEGQLTRTQLGREVRMTRKRTPYQPIMLRSANCFLVYFFSSTFQSSTNIFPFCLPNIE